jgi:flavin-dependent dehydrogenase
MIAVIGAGPAGCYYASLVKGEEVHLFEEDPEVGRPVACTGILTDSVHRVIGELPPSLIVSRIHAFKLAAPGGRSMMVDLDKVNTIVDRGAFDRWLLEKALVNGARLHLGERFTGYERLGDGYRVITTRGSYGARCIVGADGPFSAVARAAGIYGERTFVMGRQARCRFPGLVPGITEIRLTLGEFSWIVPEDASVARVGVIGRDTPALLRDYETLVGDAAMIEDQSGLIPVYNPGQKVETEENKRIIARHDRDFPSRFMVQLLMKETRLWRLGLGLLKNRVTGRTA